MFEKFRIFLHAILWQYRLKSNKFSDLDLFFSKFIINDINVFRHNLKKTDYVFDIGSHACTWSVALSKLVPNGKVFAFEASPYYSKVSKLFISFLGIKNIKIFNNAVLDENKSVEFIDHDQKGNQLYGSSYVNIEKQKNKNSQNINGTSLDIFYNSQIDDPNINISFIKIDIEGLELLALKGAKKIIAKYQPLMIIEVNANIYSGKLFEFLFNFDYFAYTVKFHQKKGIVELVQINGKNFNKTTDVLFIPKNKINKSYV